MHRLLMRTAKEIIEAIEEFAPLSNQEGWDNSGLQVGDPEILVDSALVGLDPTYELICEARDRGIKLVITHHPLIFKGIKRITEDDPTGRCIIEAIRNGIVIYSTHTASDKVADGVSGAAASCCTGRRWVSALGLLCSVTPAWELPCSPGAAIKPNQTCKQKAATKTKRNVTVFWR